MEHAPDSSKEVVVRKRKPKLELSKARKLLAMPLEDGEVEVHLSRLVRSVKVDGVDSGVGVVMVPHNIESARWRGVLSLEKARKAVEAKLDELGHSGGEEVAPSQLKQLVDAISQINEGIRVLYQGSRESDGGAKGAMTFNLNIPNMTGIEKQADKVIDLSSAPLPEFAQEQSAEDECEREDEAGEDEEGL